MAFFEELGRKAKDVAAVAADKAKDMAAVAADKARETTEKTKISVAIAGEQREIEKNCRQYSGAGHLQGGPRRHHPLP